MKAPCVCMLLVLLASSAHANCRVALSDSLFSKEIMTNRDVREALRCLKEENDRLRSELAERTRFRASTNQSGGTPQGTNGPVVCGANRYMIGLHNGSPVCASATWYNPQTGVNGAQASE